MARLAILGAVALAGCGGLSDASYGLESGDANYDTLRSATATCQAKGGAIRLRGGEGRNLSDYECAIGKAR
ncbi:MAG: hypothetical protein JWO83_1387 [Caulobacteraceae bacterium]|nr:hypothetical protein [Caulobacteraceae bacterium]